MIWLRVDPWLEPLHGDPRFQENVRRMNLPSKRATTSKAPGPMPAV
jgi:hypothetical protein